MVFIIDHTKLLSYLMNSLTGRNVQVHVSYLIHTMNGVYLAQIHLIFFSTSTANSKGATPDAVIRFSPDAT